MLLELMREAKGVLKMPLILNKFDQASAQELAAEAAKQSIHLYKDSWNFATADAIFLAAGIALPANEFAPNSIRVPGDFGKFPGDKTFNGLKLVLSALATNTWLSSFSIGKCNGNSEAAKVMAQVLETNTTLTHLECPFSLISPAEFGKALAENTTLTSLRVVGATNEKVFIEFAKALGKNTKLTSLFLECPVCCVTFEDREPSDDPRLAGGHDHPMPTPSDDPRLGR